MAPAIVPCPSSAFILRAMKFDPFLTDEPLVAPGHPGLALVRLSRLLGALQKMDDGGAATPDAISVPEISKKLARARERLLEALETQSNVGTAFESAQNALRETYASCLAQEEPMRAELLARLDFPDPNRPDNELVLPVDISTVVTTHFKPLKQVFTSLAFDESHGATAYWLHEDRLIGEHGYAREALMENWAPQFTRIRLPVGTHRLLIESRNPAASVFSEPFEIEVPRL